MVRLTSDGKIEVLQQVPLFEGLSKKHLRFIGRLTTEASLPAGTVLAEQGERGREVMVLLSGSVVVRRNKRKIAELGAGDIVGEMSLVSKQPRNATVVATSEVEVLLLDAREFSSLLGAEPKVALKILETVAARVMENSPRAT
jgi:CRP-like cAMP-binding protein